VRHNLFIYALLVHLSIGFGCINAPSLRLSTNHQMDLLHSPNLFELMPIGFESWSS